MLLYGTYSYLQILDGETLHLSSVRSLARALGTQSVQLNTWLYYLEEHGYIDSLSFSDNRREVTIRIRRPVNVRK
jgi:hypothetical protein